MAEVTVDDACTPPLAAPPRRLYTVLRMLLWYAQTTILCAVKSCSNKAVYFFTFC